MKSSVSEILTLDSAKEYVKEMKATGRTVAFTNGCFDILHVGHLRYLRAARKLADRLIVGLNTDRSVKQLKGSDRPLVPEEERAELLMALDAVDRVVLFDEPTPLSLIKTLVPDVLVKGGDYDPEATEGPTYIVGSDVVREQGGVVLTIPLVAGRSTSRLEKLLRTDR